MRSRLFFILAVSLFAVGGCDESEAPPPDRQIQLSGQITTGPGEQQPDETPDTQRDAMIQVTAFLNANSALIPAACHRNNPAITYATPWIARRIGQNFELTLTARDFSVYPAGPPGTAHSECGLRGFSGEIDRLRVRVRIGTAQGEREFAYGIRSVTVPVTVQAPTLTTSQNPDFQVGAQSAIDSIRLVRETFEANNCAVVEGCVSKAGSRRLLRFSAEIQNMSTTDFVLGPPQQNPRAEFSACHGHYHIDGIAQYELISPDNAPVAVQIVARKQGFCLQDSLEVISQGGPNGPKYTCENQGISSGWADVYGAEVDCQWVDITDVPPGDYRLRIVANPFSFFPEDDITNNAVEIPVTVTKESETP